MPDRDRKIKIIGNHTFIRVNIGRLSAHGVSLIVTAVENFQKNHPEVKVISWNVKKLGQLVYGIDINHCTRQGTR